ncbi:hypothetical protein UMM65_02265 [Aureibaculum sp. 2210JD6-5]|uniref:hypothetical protein n=1 Tax=Aureibaculum sp. 2210JD6-5 TaxID=3103957 RepID=UPI002AAE06A4|nr:hypothetical protein [Aureibaculum sp. 2210JD6-5]MDY7394050.1 hypothetical protein [Aureibaculum sp. 2210JD6-5]
MAFTIRKLSDKAEKELAKIMKDEPRINSKSKAVQSALEEREYYRKMQKEYYKLKSEHLELFENTSKIKSAINTLFSVSN